MARSRQVPSEKLTSSPELFGKCSKLLHKLKPLRPKSAFSKFYLLVFALVFAGIGGYTLWRTFGATSSVGDLNNDGVVNVLDLSILLSNYGTTSSAADINNDGNVNIFDLSILLTNYGRSVNAPTVSLSASPSSVTTGSSSTLAWSTTNATSCTASGAWSGSKSTSGSVSTGALNTTSTYTLSCTGAGGTTSASTTVTVTPPSSGTVAPPTAPQAYTLPTSATAVSTTSALQSALNGSTRDIIIEDGDYTNSAPLTAGTHRLWARHLGSATLHFGLELGANASGSGPEIHGIKFDVTNANTTSDGNILNIWGDAGANAVITDSWFYGHNVADSGIFTYVTSGFKVQRVVINGFQSYGIFFETYSPEYLTDNPSVVPIVSDADISAISRPTPGSSDGTAEAGIWAGTNAQVSRVKIRNTGWMGIWTGGNANNGVYSDFDIDQTGTGFYLEHYSRNNLIKNFVIGNATNTGVEIGFACEWADPSYAGSNPVAGQSIAACHYNTMQDGTIYSSDQGFSLEDADHTTIQRIKFVGQSHAAIKDFMTSGTGYSTIWQGLGNDFSGIKSGAVQYSTQHF